MLWSFALWAAVHIIGNGDTAAIVFFGAFLVTALAGMPSIDAKLARRDPAAWQALSAATSIVPFAAIAQGRNRFVPARDRLADGADRRGRVGGGAAPASVAVRRRTGCHVTWPVVERGGEQHESRHVPEPTSPTRPNRST